MEPACLFFVVIILCVVGVVELRPTHIIKLKTAHNRSSAARVLPRSENASMPNDSVSVKRDQYTHESPSWGIARVYHRERNELSSYTTDTGALGDGVHIYIFDTGINTAHPDFGNRAKHEGCFVDSEGDEDRSGHGTHVAGIIGGQTFGIAKNAILHNVKILDRRGDGSTVALIRAIAHVIKVAKPGKAIINLSLSGPRSQTIDDALDAAALAHNIPVFVSAGNSADDACDYSPSANPSVFTVGASTITDTVAHFSSFGQCVRMYAPGVNITSSWLQSGSHVMDGTSMASPHVTGIAAVLMSRYQYQSVYDLYNVLMSIGTQGKLSMAHADGESGASKFQHYNISYVVNFILVKFKI
ncbi:peptidase S8/S53 domain-containing protein [Radiomyces spectabilis]|uniref:peptidase S8/S53 domain-containing protein n=1 Tax=Radiomyces spectabilis TaxID=64574 RepID=UPI00221E76E9|nr:peptidase S8/S53 domain-containing protein [Radiomyces spectabilis]KAI8390909.1 peptidase S8/S53 domain-containing protein [Radiomyces spectabilis]